MSKHLRLPFYDGSMCHKIVLEEHWVSWSLTVILYFHNDDDHGIYFPVDTDTYISVYNNLLSDDGLDYVKHFKWELIETMQGVKTQQSGWIHIFKKDID